MSEAGGGCLPRLYINFPDSLTPNVPLPRLRVHIRAARPARGAYSGGAVYPLHTYVRRGRPPRLRCSFIYRVSPHRLRRYGRHGREFDLENAPAVRSCPYSGYTAEDVIDRRCRRVVNPSRASRRDPDVPAGKHDQYYSVML